MGKRQWERVLDMVGKIRGLNMEVCTTLGMLTPEQAQQLRTAGLTAYNHNLDTSPEFYPKVTSSRKYQVSLISKCISCVALQSSEHTILKPPGVDLASAWAYDQCVAACELASCKFTCIHP